MKRLVAWILCVLPLAAMAGGEHAPLDKADVDLNNKASLQRGFKYFVNYCLSCHSAGYARYNRVGRDLGIPDKVLLENVIFIRDKKNEQRKPGDLMKVTMSEDYAKDAFGTAPPDLTLVARVRGADWLYTYLRSFYLDDSRPFGVNNTVFPNVGMPHVLWELQGWQKLQQPAAAEEGEDGHHGAADGAGHAEPRLVLVKQGTMSPAEYDQTVRDIVNFLVYLGEPVKLKRQTIGLFVILFLVLFSVLAYFLKKEYWKDVH